METSRLDKKLFSFAAAFAVVAVAVCFSSAIAIARQAGGVNLYQDVEAHKATIAWQTAPATNYPQDACDIISACTADGAPPKVLVIPTATVDGRKVARAVYLVKIKDAKNPEAVVFEHQTASATYFFRVNPDGSINSVAYLTRGANWLPVATQNGLAVSTFQKDAPDWHATLAKGGK
jgi:hypothetical protein